MKTLKEKYGEYKQSNFLVGSSVIAWAPIPRLDNSGSPRTKLVGNMA